jgi:putative endonuclease
MNKPPESFYVYIMSSRSRTLYIGFTNDLVSRVWQHMMKTADGFTSQYNINRLIYFEEFASAKEAIIREKQLKGWRRERKITLIEQSNPAWDDLSDGWYEDNS